VVQWRPAGPRVTPVPPPWKVLPAASRQVLPTQVVGDGRVGVGVANVPGGGLV
jgi:hypothetical protein